MENTTELISARGLAKKFGFTSEYYWKLRHRGYMPADKMIDARWAGVLQLLRQKLDAGLRLSVAFAQAKSESGIGERPMQRFECDGCGVSLPSETDGQLTTTVAFNDMAVLMSLRAECPYSGRTMHFCIACVRGAVTALDHTLNRGLKPIPLLRQA